MGQTFILNWNTQLKKGLLTLLVLNIIKRKNCYGKEMIEIIKQETGITIAEGTLYPILKKLKNEQCVLCKWNVEDNDSPKKYYYLTGKGGQLLQEMNANWFSMASYTERIIGKKLT